MSTQALTIFIVDDEPIARVIAMEELAGGAYQLEEFDTGEACIAALERKPDIVLLDIEMPGVSGIEVCRALRARSDDCSQVIFISSHDDLETRLQAYDAGGNDYVVKPYAAEELAKKVAVAERALTGKRLLAEQASYAQMAAFTAMSSMGEMGAVIEFLRASFACSTPAELAHAMFAALGQYGLQGFAELRVGAVSECSSSSGARCSALEVSILGHARKTDRLFQFHDRLAVNYPSITLLLTNLPLEDPDRAGRYRDHLAIIAEGAQSRLEAMAVEMERARQAEAIVMAVSEITDMLGDIEARQASHRQRMLELSMEFIEALNNAFIHLGLTENQEAVLINMARASHDRIGELLDDDQSLGAHLREIARTLRGFAPSPAAPRDG
jgi:CheY-like chemotaxis protein